MGILVKIAAGVEIADKALEVAEKLKAMVPSRAVVIQVHNHTDHTLRLQTHEHSSGRFGELPSQRIPPHTVDIYGSRRRGRPEGAAGWTRYQVEGSNALCTVAWKLRWRSWRSSSSDSELRGTDAHRFEITDLIGGGSSLGEAKFEFFRRNGDIIIDGSDGSGGSHAGGPGTGGPGKRPPTEKL